MVEISSDLIKRPNVSIRDADEVTDEFGMRKLMKIACKKNKKRLSLK